MELQSPAALPSQEEQRLKCLHALRILDTPPDPALDTLVALAASTLDCPVALVSLVDAERQWFKARHGLRVEEGQRCHSFCSHAIGGEGAFVVVDARQDSRFADNPLVTGDPFIRFYAGIPLRVGGHAIGTLCVVDRAARTLADHELTFLQQCASLAEATIERHAILNRAILEEARMHDFAAASGDFLWECDTQLHVTWVSPSVQRVLGLDPSTLVGRPLWNGELMDASDLPAALTLHASKADGRAYTDRTIAWQHADARHALSFSAVPVPDGQGEAIGWRGVCRDVTAARELDAIRLSLRLADERARGHNDFLARVSHDLRSPLNAILGLTQTLMSKRDAALAAQHQRWLELIHRAGQQLLALVEDLLQLTHAHARLPGIAMQPLNPAVILAECIEMLQPQIAQSGMSVLLEPPVGPPVSILADGVGLRRALTNVLTNALKYGRSGRPVECDVSREGQECRIRIRDHGPGWPQARAHELFAPFARLGAEQGPQSGTGLGLSITKGLVEGMGGRVHGITPDDGGACFVITFPASGNGPQPVAEVDPSWRDGWLASPLVRPSSCE